LLVASHSGDRITPDGFDSTTGSRDAFSAIPSIFEVATGIRSLLQESSPGHPFRGLSFEPRLDQLTIPRQKIKLGPSRTTSIARTGGRK
jgi:hypothetical protein